MSILSLCCRNSCNLRALIVFSLTAQTVSFMNVTMPPFASDISPPTPTNSSSPTIVSSPMPSISKSPTSPPTPNPTPSPTLSSKPTYEGCRPKQIDINYYCPFDRYCEWAYYSLEKQNEFTNTIGYNERTWNIQQRSPLEEMTFLTLPSGVQKGLTDLGFNEDKHDCCQNHYDDYDWSDFDPNEGYKDVIDALEVLGYNENMWTNSIPAASDDYWWDDLPEEMQFAAMELCYSRETWNQFPLHRWPIDVDLPGAFPYENVSPSPAPTNTPTTSAVDGGGGGGQTNMSSKDKSSSFSIRSATRLCISVCIVSLLIVLSL